MLTNEYYIKKLRNMKPVQHYVSYYYYIWFACNCEWPGGKVWIDILKIFNWRCLNIVLKNMITTLISPKDVHYSVICYYGLKLV